MYVYLGRCFGTWGHEQQDFGRMCDAVHGLLRFEAEMSVEQGFVESFFSGQMSKPMMMVGVTTH